jgi:hypothetical protein
MVMDEKLAKFKEELMGVVNRNSMETGGDVPDFIIAEFLCSCYVSFHTANKQNIEYHQK